MDNFRSSSHFSFTSIFAPQTRQFGHFFFPPKHVNSKQNMNEYDIWHILLQSRLIQITAVFENIYWEVLHCNHVAPYTYTHFNIDIQLEQYWITCLCVVLRVGIGLPHCAYTRHVDFRCHPTQGQPKVWKMHFCRHGPFEFVLGHSRPCQKQNFHVKTQRPFGACFICFTVVSQCFRE